MTAIAMCETTDAPTPTRDCALLEREANFDRTIGPHVEYVLRERGAERARG